MKTIFTVQNIKTSIILLTQVQKKEQAARDKSTLRDTDLILSMINLDPQFKHMKIILMPIICHTQMKLTMI